MRAGNHQGRSSAHLTPLLSTELSTVPVHSVQAVLSGGEGGLQSGLHVDHPAELELTGGLLIDRRCAPCLASVCSRCTFHSHRNGGASSPTASSGTLQYSRPPS